MIGVRSGCPRRRPVLPGAVTAAAALVVVTGSLPGGRAMAEPLADGSYRIGFLEVSETGWIDGIGTTSVEARDGTMSDASLESRDRGLELDRVAVSGDDLHLEVAPTAPDAGQEGSWRPLGPGGEQTGTTTGGEVEIPSV